MKRKFGFNLQLFNDGAEPTGEMVDASAPADTGAADPSTETEPQESGKLDKAFAARLGHEKKKIEAEFSPYKSVIERQAKESGMEVPEYLDYLAQQELEEQAEALGKTPEQLKLEQENAELKADKEKHERQQKMTAEEKELTADPKIGKFITDNLDKMRTIAEQAGVDLRVAMAIVASEKLPELLEQTNPEVHIKKYLESLKNGAKPIEIGGGASTPSVTSPKTFDEAKKSAIEKLKKGSE